MPDMAKAIDEAYRAHGFFEDLRKRGWHPVQLHAFRYAQLGRRFRNTRSNRITMTGDLRSYDHGNHLHFAFGRKFLAYQNHAAECTQWNPCWAYGQPGWSNLQRQRSSYLTSYSFSGHRGTGQPGAKWHRMVRRR